MSVYTGETAGDQAAESTKIAAQLMKNPQVLAALQDKLGSIIGTPSGYIQSLVCGISSFLGSTAVALAYFALW